MGGMDMSISADCRELKFTTAAIKSITAGAMNTEEQMMLENVKSIQHMLLPLEPLALYRMCKMLPDNAKILELGSC